MADFTANCGTDIEDREAKSHQMAKPKRKLTAAQRRARRNRKRNYMMIFINGKQKWVPRPQQIGGLPAEEYLARNADPAWLLQNGYWELLPSEGQRAQPDQQVQKRQLDMRDRLDQDEEPDHWDQQEQHDLGDHTIESGEWETDEIPF